MSDRNNVRLAVGYGLGAGIALVGLLLVVAELGLSLSGRSLYVLAFGGSSVLGGVVIAVYNALKMDREAVEAVEGGPE